VWGQIQPFISELKTIRAEFMEALMNINDSERLSALEPKLRKYIAIESKLLMAFPFGSAPDQIKIIFTWHDSIVSKTSKNSSNLLFDKLSMMHNLIALDC